jgi:GH25 family lysozyme M1 (1,4-beta-N-acetylmuramidase)
MWGRRTRPSCCRPWPGPPSPNGAAITWSKVAAAGYKFTAIKAAEGNYYANPYRAPDLTGAEKAKLSVIAYEFAIPNVSGGAAQADYVIAHAADESGKVAPIGLDIEYDPYSATDRTNECYGLGRSAMTSWVAAAGRLGDLGHLAVFQRRHRAGDRDQRQHRRG